MSARHPYLRPLGPYQIDLVQELNRRAEQERRDRRHRVLLVAVALVSLVMGLACLIASSMAGAQ